MRKPNFKMMGAAIRLGWRSTKLGVKAFPNRYSMRLRFKQVVMCARAFFKGLMGAESPQ